jgi:tetraacyldisaccharide 4'-kinase
MINILRLLLWPFSLLYGLVIAIRNFLYDKNIFKSQKFDFPVIVIGNLAVGGTGKSPLTEYLIRLLKDSFKVASLSRGYGRETSGFIYVEKTDSFTKVGDEPLQFKNKYPEVTVAVCENRVEGVLKLKDEHDVIILDDAFQHRSLTPGLSILLFDYESLFKPRLLLPAGNFRDSFTQRKRADIIVITKSPSLLPEEKKEAAVKRLDLKTNQHVLFSSLDYGNPYPVFKASEGNEDIFGDESEIVLVTGIVNPKPLLKYLDGKCHKIELVSYADHHSYTQKDIEFIIEKYKSLSSKRKFIVSTEKDLQRLKRFLNDPSFNSLPIWIIPVEAYFNKGDKQRLNSLVLDYCHKNLN